MHMFNQKTIYLVWKHLMKYKYVYVFIKIYV